MQVTTAQKQADAAANAKVVLILMIAGLLAGLMIWAAILPAELKTVPAWRLAWALLTDPDEAQPDLQRPPRRSHHLFFIPLSFASPCRP